MLSCRRRRYSPPTCLHPHRLPVVATGPAYRILNTAVLEVAAEPVRQWVDEMYGSCLEATLAAACAGDAAAACVCVLHLGVDVKGHHFKLERQAANDATFRVPDRRGWQPQGVLVDDQPGLSLATRLHTDLDVAALAGARVLYGRGRRTVGSCTGEVHARAAQPQPTLRPCRHSLQSGCRSEATMCIHRRMPAASSATSPSISPCCTRRGRGGATAAAATPSSCTCRPQPWWRCPASCSCCVTCWPKLQHSWAAAMATMTPQQLTRWLHALRPWRQRQEAGRQPGAAVAELGVPMAVAAAAARAAMQ